jgi:hypothetical protein
MRWVKMFTLLGISLGLRQSMPIFVLNMLFAIEKHISVSLTKSDADQTRPSYL